MLRSLSSRLVLTALLGCFALPALAFAQSQSDESVAAAAKKARDQKKTSQKPVKVVTEDDIPARIGGSSDQPATPAAATEAPAASPADGSAAGQPPAGSTSKTGASKPAKAAEIKALKENIARTAEEADFLTRSLALGEDSFFSNPDYAHDTAGKAKLDDIKQQIEDKQGSLAQLKAKLAEVLGGVPAVTDTEEPPPVVPAPQS